MASIALFDDAPAGIYLDLIGGLSDLGGGYDQLFGIEYVLGTGFRDTLDGNDGANVSRATLATT